MRVLSNNTQIFMLMCMWFVLSYCFFTYCYKSVALFYHDLHNLGQVNFVGEEQSTAIGFIANPRKKSKIILFWNSFFGLRDFGFGLGNDVFDKHCSSAFPKSSRCATTSNKKLLAHADAVVVHIRDKWKPIPRNVTPEQKWVFVLEESPVHTPQYVLRKLRNVFHWTMTYRLDTDILLPYGGIPTIIRRQNASRLSYERKRLMSLIKGKTKLVAWFASNCNTNSKRELYVAELQKFISVDVYGFCGPLKCDSTKERCYEMLERDYKFYLAFENSICKDYVTEKLFTTLDYYVVPVVLGGANYSQVAPPHSVINVNDFPTAEALAKYLLFLNDHNDIYQRYFQWKETHEMKNVVNPFCKLCHMLHQNATDTKRYTDIFKWWVTDGRCSVPKETWRGLPPFFHSLL